jgi:hypothetical protein
MPEHRIAQKADDSRNDSIIERPEMLIETWLAHRSQSGEGAQHSHVSACIRSRHLYFAFWRQYFHVFTLTGQGSYRHTTAQSFT